MSVPFVEYVKCPAVKGSSMSGDLNRLEAGEAGEAEDAKLSLEENGWAERSRMAWPIVG